MEFVPDSEFGRYRIRRLLGRGGMGAVYEAVHVDLGKRVALKTLSGALGLREDARARFLREARAAARLDHPHVVDVSDVGIVDDVPFLIMEYLEGEDLHQLLERDGALAVPRSLEIVLPIAWALASAHELHIVHRDIKPQNVFLARTKQGTIAPKLLDFGISKLSDGDGQPALTGSVSLLGTPSYMSPEQVRGAKYVDARSDQYSLGVLLYECVAGALPFDQTELYPLLNAISTGMYRPLAQARPGLPPAFVEAVERALALNPDERHASMLEFGRALLPLASREVEAAWRATFVSNAETRVHGDTLRVPHVGRSSAAPAEAARSAAAPVEPGRSEEGAPSIDAIATTLARAKRRSRSRPALLGGGVALAALFWAWHFRLPAGSAEVNAAGAGVQAAALPRTPAAQAPLALPAPSTNDTAPNGVTAPNVVTAPSGVALSVAAPTAVALSVTAPSGTPAPSASSAVAPRPVAAKLKPSRGAARNESGSVPSPSVRPAPVAVPTNHPISTPNNAPILE
jgi:serine/threonine protein kinase